MKRSWKFLLFCYNHNPEINHHMAITNMLLGDQYKRSSNRRSLKYAVQIQDQGRTVKVITVSVDIAGGMPPPVIKQTLERKVFSFIHQMYPVGVIGIKAIIVGRIDLEI